MINLKKVQGINVKWISVKDRLPEIDVEVLVTEGGYCKVSRIVDVNEYSREKARTRKDKYPIKIEWVQDSYCDIDWDISHWMKLPELPKEDQHFEGCGIRTQDYIKYGLIDSSKKWNCVENCPLKDKG